MTIYTTVNFTRLSVVLVTVAAAMASWWVILTGWQVTVGVVSQPGADAERYRCACLHCTRGLAGRGDRYQCGLDWGRSSMANVG